MKTNNQVKSIRTIYNSFLNSLVLSIRLNLHQKNVYSQSWTLLIISLLLALFTFGFELFNFSYSLDEELATFGDQRKNLIYIRLGRWGVNLINYLVNPGITIPYLPFFIGILGIAFSSFLFISNEPGPVRGKLIFSVIFITHPFHVQFLTYNIINHQVGIGLCITVLSFAAYRKALNHERFKWVLFSLSALLLVFALAIYQAFMAVFAVLAAYHFFSSFVFAEGSSTIKTIKSILTVILITSVSYLLYKVTVMLSQFYVFGQVENNEVNYLNRFIGWGRLPVPAILERIIIHIKNLTIGDLKLYGAGNLAAALSIPFMVWFTVKKFSDFKNRAFSVFLIAILVISPFSLMLINGQALPERTLMSVPLASGIILWLVFRFSAPYIRSALIIFTLVILVNNTYINTRYFYKTWLSWQADRAMAQRVLMRINELDFSKSIRLQPVTFAGRMKRLDAGFKNGSENTHTSFFDWGPFEPPHRINYFYKSMGINYLKIRPFSETRISRDSVNAMPEWPAKGSVKLFENLIVVKLSKNIQSAR